MKTKLSPRFWCALTLFSLVGQVAWVVENMYFNVFIYRMFNASATDISAMVAASAVAATLTTLLMGSLSDRVGKRKLFICGGYLLWGISIFSFVFLRMDVIEAVFPLTVNAAAIGVTLVIIMDCVMTFFGSTANDAAFNAWVTDSTDHTNRGAVEGINAMMPLLAILVVFGGFMSFDLTDADSWVRIFSLIGGAVFLIGLLGFFLIKDPPLQPSDTGFTGIFYGFRPAAVRANPLLYLVLAAFSVFNISIQVFMPYLLLYYEVSLGLTNYVLIMAPAIVLAAVATAFWGKVYDRKGFRTSVTWALVWLCTGYILLFLFRAVLPVFLGSLLMMSGYLAGMAVFGALIRDCTPAGKAGLFQGLRIFAQVLIPGVIGPYIGALVLSGADVVVNGDGTTSFVPNAYIFLAAFAVILLLLPLLRLIFRRQRPKMQSLPTPWEPGSWEDYPRPQLKRSAWQCLNGPWSLSVEHRGRETDWGTIRVPFPPESDASGIGRTPGRRDTLIYRRRFTPEGPADGQRMLLHFGAADQQAQVFINGQEAGSHTGGYLPFSFDITELLQPGENELLVRVQDPLDPDLPYGKQRRKRGGMWYTPISGLWQTVWLECVPTSYIRTLRITPTLTSVTLETEGGEEEKTLQLHTPEGIREYSYRGSSFTLTLEQPHLWSPEDPYLYFFTLRSGTDQVDSYFALRTITIESDGRFPRLCLNGQPYFFHGLLDQGYFSDGIYLPGSPEGYTHDVRTMKELGFNTLRKHIKIEPERFYYDCDRLGMIVFQDFVNSGRYSFFKDTVLPTLGLKTGVSHLASARRRAFFEEAARETVAHLYNHPCVLYYTIFNEGWGQYDANRLYAQLKSLDPSRIWDTASGWFRGADSDVASEHIYFKPLKLTAGPRPLVLSEFGGYSCKYPEHSFNLSRTYGYRFFEDPAAFADALEALYRDELLPLIPQGLCAAILTQVSDVEDETNGLMTYDRQVTKVEPARMQPLADALQQALKKTTL